MNRPFIETLPKKAERGRNRREIRDLAELRVQPCGPLHPCSYWIVIKRSRASDRAHCPVIHSSSPDYFSLCVSTRRRKKNKPPLIHVFLPHDYVKRRGPKPGSTIRQTLPLLRAGGSEDRLFSILWNCCVRGTKGLRPKVNSKWTIVMYLARIVLTLVLYRKYTECGVYRWYDRRGTMFCNSITHGNNMSRKYII